MLHPDSWVRGSRADAALCDAGMSEPRHIVRYSERWLAVQAFQDAIKVIEHRDNRGTRLSGSMHA